MRLKYPIAIEPGDEKTAFGAVVPDLAALDRIIHEVGR